MRGTDEDRFGVVLADERASAGSVLGVAGDFWFGLAVGIVAGNKEPLVDLMVDYNQSNDPIAHLTPAQIAISDHEVWPQERHLELGDAKENS